MLVKAEARPRPRRPPPATHLSPDLAPGIPSEMAAKLKALERENRELRQANEILRKASAYFAAAVLERRSRT